MKATAPDLAAFKVQLEEAAVLDDHGAVSEMIRTGEWREPEVARFLERFKGRPLVHACLLSLIDRAREDRP